MADDVLDRPERRAAGHTGGPAVPAPAHPAWACALLDLRIQSPDPESAVHRRDPARRPPPPAPSPAACLAAAVCCAVLEHSLCILRAAAQASGGGGCGAPGEAERGWVGPHLDPDPGSLDEAVVAVAGTEGLPGPPLIPVGVGQGSLHMEASTRDIQDPGSRSTLHALKDPGSGSAWRAGGPLGAEGREGGGGGGSSSGLDRLVITKVGALGTEEAAAWVDALRQRWRQQQRGGRNPRLRPGAAAGITQGVGSDPDPLRGPGRRLDPDPPCQRAAGSRSGPGACESPRVIIAALPRAEAYPVDLCMDLPAGAFLLLPVEPVAGTGTGTGAGADAGTGAGTGSLKAGQAGPAQAVVLQPGGALQPGGMRAVVPPGTARIVAFPPQLSSSSCTSCLVPGSRHVQLLEVQLVADTHAGAGVGAGAVGAGAGAGGALQAQRQPGCGCSTVMESDRCVRGMGKELGLLCGLVWWWGGGGQDEDRAERLGPDRV